MGNNKPLLWTVILAAAGAESANAQITGTPEAGSYYFKNVDSGMFLGGANSWGTQASLIKHGIVFKVELDNGKYTLDSNVSNGGESHYFTGTFIDGGKTSVEIIETKESGKYVMKIGDSYVVADGSIIKSDGTDEANAVKWQIIPVADLTKAFETATFENPADATFLIQNPNFSRNHKSDLWKIEGARSNGAEKYNPNRFYEAWNCNFKASQELKDIPNGLYKLTVQGFDRYTANKSQSGSESLDVRAKVFANNDEIDFPSVNRKEDVDALGYAPDNENQTFEAFSKGLYKSEPLYVYVSDRKLTIGVKKETSDENKGWASFDNFELAYIGDINIDAVREELTNKLAIQINKAGKYTEDEALQKLAVEAAKLQTVINTIVAENPDAYVMVANYNSGVKGNIGEQIENLGAEISKATANYEAWVAAQEAHEKVLTPTLAGLTAVYNGAADETKAAAKEMYDGLVQDVAKFLTDAKAAYEKGEAGDLFSKANIESKVQGEEGLVPAIDEAIKAITEGSTNALSYANVNRLIANTNSKYSDEAARLYALLSGAPDGETYQDTYLKALEDLSSVKRDINAVEAKNKAVYDEGNANEETQKNFADKLTECEGKLEAITTKYKELVGEIETPAEGTLRANYKAACDDVDAITAKLKTDITDAIDKRSKVLDFYKEAISDIEADIKALQTNVNAANEAHTIKGDVDSYCENYKEDKDAIVAKIAELKDKVDLSITEYDANEASVKAINGVKNKYNDTKKVVDGQKEGDYTTSGRFAASEKAIEDAVAALEAAAMNAYKVDGTGSAEDFFNKINNDETIEEVTRLGITSIGSKISDYQANAEASFEAYKKIAAALTNYNLLLNGKDAEGTEGEEGYVPAVEGLKDVVKNLDVTIDGTFDGKTYKVAIEEIEARIAVVKSNLDKANEKVDVEHKNAITAIDVDADIETEINTLKTKYADMETEWNKVQLAAAKARLLEEANRRVESFKLEEEYTAEVYGKTATELNESNQIIKDALATLKENIKNAETEEDAKAIATLSDVVDKIDGDKGIQKDYDALVAKADSAKKEYAADQEALKILNAEVERVGILLNGGKYNKVDYKGVAATDNNAGRFTTEIGNVNALIDAMKAEIAVSNTNETVRKDKADSTGEDSKVVLGYDNRLKAIETQVNNLITLAGNEVANDKAKDDFATALTEAGVEQAIADAKTELNKDENATGEGRAYFLKLHDNYKTEYNNICSEKDAAYKAVVKSELEGTLKDNAKYTDTTKNMVACSKDLSDRLTAVKANIEGLAALAKANETEHNNQTEASKGAHEAWDKAFNDITGKESSSAQEAAIAELTNIKKNLAEYDKAVVDAFAKGECDTKKAELEAQLAQSTNAIKTLSDGWEDKYNAAVAEDNVKRKEIFDKAYDVLVKTYQDKTALVNKLSKLSYASGSNATDKLIEITGENGIFSYIEKIRTLKADAEASFNAVEVGKLWDAEEDNCKLANDYKTIIEGFATDYSNEVNNIALTTFNRERDAVQANVDDAVNEMVSVLGVRKEDLKKNANVKAVQAIIDDANEKAAIDDKNNFVNPDFAYLLDSEILPNFASIDNKIAECKENTAVETWNDAISSANTLAEAEYAAIQKFGVDILADGAISALYAENEMAYIDVAAEAWSTIAENEKYANYAIAKDELDKFTGTVSKREVGMENDEPVYETHTEAYWNAKAKEDQRLANDATYKEMLATVNGLQVQHDNAVAHVHSMMVMLNDNLNGRLNTAQIKIDELRQLVEDTKGVIVEDDKQQFNDDVKVQETAIELICSDAIEKETGAIEVAVGNLYKDYDLAAAKNIGDTSIDKYKDIIKGYETENAAIYSEFTVGIITGYDEETKLPIYKTDDNGVNVTTTPEEARIAYLALEKKIGVTKSELTAIYDASAADNALVVVNGEIAKLETTLEVINTQIADCHVPVVNEYQSAIDRFTAAVASLKDRVVQEAEDNTVLLYEDVNIRAAQNIADKYKNLASDIEEAEKPYDVNDAVYAALSDELKALQGKLDAVVNVAKDYEYKCYWSVDHETGETETIPYYEYYSRVIGTDIAEEQARIDELNSEYKLISDSKINKSIDESINSAERVMAYHNVSGTYNNVSESHSSACYMMSQIANGYEDKFYTDNIWSELDGTNSDIDDNLKFAYEFYNSVYYYGKCNHDIDGNYFIDPEDENSTVEQEFDFMEQYPAIMNKFVELNEAITQFARDVKDKSSLYGDIDNNGKINVTDYNIARNYIIGVEEVMDLLDNDEARFAAADVKKDGEINIGDVIQIAQKIMFGEFVPNKEEAVSVRLSALMPNQSVGNELTVTATGSGMRQTINIAIADVKDFVGAQMDIVLPAGVTVVGENGVSGHDFISGDVDGAHRVLLSSLEGEVFGSNNLVTIEVEVSSDFKGGAVEVKNAKFSDVNGKLYTIGNISGGEATGITELTLGEKVISKVYSVGGQLMNGLKKGINIIVNSDGTTKKIYNK